ncbi:MAG: HAD-IC family P-type ATPase, partial [Victivallaceae bacterium]
CALGLATPMSVMATTGRAAQKGVLFKDAEAIEALSKVTTLIIDKTGTLTDGLLSVVKLSPFDEISPSDLLGAAAAAEQNSNHPTAQAVMRLAAEAGVKVAAATEFSEEHGKGVRAKVDGKEYLVGRAAYLETQGIEIPEHESDEAAQGMSTIYVSCDGKILGWIGMKDKLRKEAVEMINSLRQEGIKHIAMVTGDRESVAMQVADKLQLDEYISGCLPETKAEYVEKMKHNAKVAVVGDGVNDAPALAAGDLGIAMGAIGSDIAISSASIALMTNDLRRIPMLVFLSRRSQKIILQNLIIGMLFVLGGIVLAVFGKLNPIYAALLQVLSTIIVIFNSARLVRTGEELTLQDREAQN